MEALPHWPEILRAYGSKNRTWRQMPKHVRCERNPLWGTAKNPAGGNAYKCANIYLGNTLFAPVLGSARLLVWLVCQRARGRGNVNSPRGVAPNSAKFVPLRRCASVAADFCTILTAQADAPCYALLGANDKNIPEINRVPPSAFCRD